MIKGLYETHLFVENLERSIVFYANVLGLELCHFEAERRIAFFWVGKPKEAMLGLWDFLKERNLKPYNFSNDGTERPMVFCWMPAIAIYFNDPDGNQLEFLSILDGKARPELGVISYEEWLKL